MYLIFSIFEPNFLSILFSIILPSYKFNRYNTNDEKLIYLFKYTLTKKTNNYEKFIVRIS